jgi:hypothetical protein
VRIGREPVDRQQSRAAIAEPGQPVGNGLAPWFEAADFDAVVGRIRALAVRVESDVHVNPNAGHREIWIRDLDGYLVVFDEPCQSPVRGRTPDR